jgi:hypothetical protein
VHLVTAAASRPIPISGESAQSPSRFALQ